jgi:hypothetical protein
VLSFLCFRCSKTNYSKKYPIMTETTKYKVAFKPVCKLGKGLSGLVYPQGAKRLWSATKGIYDTPQRLTRSTGVARKVTG